MRILGGCTMRWYRAAHREENDSNIFFVMKINKGIK